MSEHSEFTDEEINAVRERFEKTTLATTEEKNARAVELGVVEGSGLNARGKAILTMLEGPRTATKAEIAALSRHYTAKTDKEIAAANQELLDVKLGYVSIYHGSVWLNLRGEMLLNYELMRSR
ncbi:hypothetical protein ELH24_10060 [Rhizobium ruizarguesonis]|uniref:hypothetical protein n=1 Tax=Rhizobium ruizarguesonis TaxID=2081791 RepID=UPI001031D2D5|nr:hypothetical protein [Rhizobium ruizarguesonis]TBC98983.1 hypothetical protein ELH25_10015 [Rhizobium ruizarguesonis]TBD15833.1 hypothetical protein ELH24_10060 [Rhizobium ruizarguesonis]TBD27749.1 hypothetical protein ELH20_09345 [Rhizobium ruizarguesonis]TBE32925.1 hypothetical protein ELH07_09865 [Rhizobium ruizarguesonis]TBE96847.1 hypothetical protein ELG98_09815 [Rhizobium ruizarguesonis]